MKITCTVREAMDRCDRGWDMDRVFAVQGWGRWALNEGQVSESEEVIFTEAELAWVEGRGPRPVTDDARESPHGPVTITVDPTKGCRDCPLSDRSDEYEDAEIGCGVMANIEGYGTAYAVDYTTYYARPTWCPLLGGPVTVKLAEEG